MNATTAIDQHPIMLLFELGERAKEVAKGLPQKMDVAEVWSGIAFRIGKIHLVSPLDQVNEILYCPKLTLVPGTQKWVKGVANIRGTLMPIMDLNGFLGIESTTPTLSQSRVLVIKEDENLVGLMVDEVLGIRHFSNEDKVTSVARFDEALRAYVRGAFRRHGQETLVFNMQALANHPDFYHVVV